MLNYNLYVRYWSSVCKKCNEMQIQLFIDLVLELNTNNNYNNIKSCTVELTLLQWKTILFKSIYTVGVL